MSDLNHSERWSGRYRGVALEIRRTDRPMLGCGHKQTGFYDLWAYYLYLHEKQVPASKQHRFFLPNVIRKISLGGRDWLTHDYTDSAWADLPWHGGITYYRHECEVAGFRVAGAGCDYNHYGDDAEQNPFCLRGVRHDAHATVDALIEAHPDLLVFCSWTGKYCPHDEMEEWGNGYISAEGRSLRAAKNVAGAESDE